MIADQDERNAFRHDVGKRLQRLNEKGLVAMQKRGGRLFWVIIGESLTTGCPTFGTGAFAADPKAPP